MRSDVRIVASSLDDPGFIRVSVGITKYGSSAVPALRVPERFRTGIVRVVGLSQEGFDQLLAALKKAPACRDIRELLTWITDETPSINKADRESIIQSIVPMFRVQRNADVSPANFASDVWDGLEEAAAGKDRALFVERIELLIKESAFDLASSRIWDVKSEVERNFCKIRIMTDLRPAFSRNPEEVPSDLAVIHNLQIGYHDGMAQHHEFYISLDAADLESLKCAIAEAEKRAETLERMLGTNGIRLHK